MKKENEEKIKEAKDAIEKAKKKQTISRISL